jgi:hypothetical protein
MLRSATCSIAVGAALAALSLPACAFQESTVGGGAGKPAMGAGGTPQLGLSLPDAGAKESAGTEIRIPGVGTVGVLPKIDFGLELLYGAEPPGRPDDRSPSDGMQLRAKYRF